MTETSEFGVSKREGHYSSKFYNRKFYEYLRLPKPSKDDLRGNVVPKEYLDRIIVGDAQEVLKNNP